jgi:hypothetical protein
MGIKLPDRRNVASEEQDMIDALVELLEEDDGRFTAWEQSFVEDMKRKIDKNYSLTEAQVEKLRQIYDERLDS